jgi:hypothetical protein
MPLPLSIFHIFAFDFFRRHCRFDYFHIAPRRAIFDADAFISLMPLFSFHFDAAAIIFALLMLSPLPAPGTCAIAGVFAIFMLLRHSPPLPLPAIFDYAMLSITLLFAAIA